MPVTGFYEVGLNNNLYYKHDIYYLLLRNERYYVSHWHRIDWLTGSLDSKLYHPSKYMRLEDCDEIVRNNLYTFIQL